MKHKATPLPVPFRRLRSGFTLTEIMIASSISLVVIVAVLAVVLAVTRSTRKAEFLAAALQNSREVQEYLKREVSSAANTVDGATALGLSFGVPNGSGRYARLSYRVPVGDPLRVKASVSQSSKTITLIAPAGVSVEPGDYVVIPVPFTGSKLRAASVENGDIATEREVKVTCNMTLADATEGTKQDLTVDEAKDIMVYVSVYRDRKFEVDDPGGASVATLRWWLNASDDTTARVLSVQVASSDRYMFEPVPNDLAAAEPVAVHSVRWHFTYQGTNPTSGMLPGAEQFWDRNVSEGEFWARSGDPERPAASPPENALTSLPTTSTTSTTTTSTTKTTTTSIKTTSTKKTTTTSIKTTSTKKPTTTSTSSIKTTSTSKPTTKPPTTMQDG